MKLNSSQIKLFIGKILTSALFYHIFVKHGLKNSCLKTSKGFISVEKQDRYIKSLLFWGLYENSERKTISKYIKKDLAVIELGASIGMTTITICNMVNKNVPVISVEANPLLIPNLEKTKDINRIANLVLIHGAIDYSNESEIPFIIDNRNLGSRKGDDGSLMMVPALKLSEILTRHKIGPYVLVSDIEGAEAELILSEYESFIFENCRQIIIELHDTSCNGEQYTKLDLVKLITDRFAMNMVSNKGQTWVFEK
jgi:FkbM family methyltransferase